MLKILSKSMICALASTLLIHSANATGFQNRSQDAKMQGSSFAGSTAEASHLSTIFYNPAGMTRFNDTEIEINVNYMVPKTTLRLDSTANSYISTVNNALTDTPLGNGDGGNSSIATPTANIYYINHYDDNIKFGLAINAPFGSSSAYDEGWAGRYHALKSNLKTINIAPSIAYQIDDKISLGWALQIQRAEAELTNAVQDFATGLAENDGHAKLTGSNTAFGYRFGVLYDIQPTTRIGFSYNSKVRHALSGRLEFTNLSTAARQVIANAGRQSVSHDITASLVTPDIISVGIAHELDKKWTLLGDISRTNWSVYKDLTVYDHNGVRDESVAQNWKASYFIALGAKYKYDDSQTLRFGIAHDQTPVKDEFRTVRRPDASRNWFSLGYHYEKGKINSNIAYSYVKANSVNIVENNSAITRGTISGVYDASAHIISFNSKWKF